MESVILVDYQDKELGTMEKLAAHQKGLLHRCFSILVFNSKNELLIHKRADGKYHCGGLWTNTCCSHQRPGESTLNAAHRRLKEEMGFDCDLVEKFNFIYKAKFDNGLTEHEFDHVLFGKYDGDVEPDATEVSDYAWLSLDDLRKKIKTHPESYTPWFRIILDFIKNPQTI